MAARMDGSMEENALTSIRVGHLLSFMTMAAWLIMVVGFGAQRFWASVFPILDHCFSYFWGSGSPKILSRGYQTPRSEFKVKWSSQKLLLSTPFIQKIAQLVVQP